MQSGRSGLAVFLTNRLSTSESRALQQLAGKLLKALPRAVISAQLQTTKLIPSHTYYLIPILFR